ncbi:unnamed protein product, partial [Phaeothamnion confervicola]
TLQADSPVDLAYGLGFVHAQDRLFQMEGLRRYAGGELADLFGPGEGEMLVRLDRKIRALGLRQVARRTLGHLPEDQVARLNAYVLGVNAGRRSLAALPFEFSLLKAKPAPWTPEDSLLVILALYLDLQGDNPPLESAVGLVHDLLPAPLAQFLTPTCDPDWDSPLYGDTGTPPDLP